MTENGETGNGNDKHSGSYDGTFNVCIAMCDSNRGFGLNGHHAWPHLPTDFKYYMALTGAPKQKGKIVVNIKGRQTWAGTSDAEKDRPGVLNILISRTLRSPPHPKVESVFPSLKDAIDYLSSNVDISSRIESVWIMGGEQLYNEALKHSSCKRVHLTRVYGEFRSDRFLDKFEHNYRLLDKNNLVDPAQMFEENGVKYKFEIYERGTSI